MKTIIVLLSTFFIISIVNAQELSNRVKSEVESQVRSLCEKYNVNYRGPVNLTSSKETEGQFVVEGRVSYYSNKCGDVNARFNATFKVILDDVSVTCFVLYMPWCYTSWLGANRYDSEYTVGCCEECK